ncbi:MAG TPA: GlsB/YeaQ/YmgE family stress response membrane protein [Kiritimatiellia bacterium]|nr:GlsB/YeaQ/YmgE family stress response membrane protein [Kiritimatiellia bacterium]
MDINQLVTILIVGGVAGWVAGLIIKGGGFGIIGNIVVGILGAFAGGFIFQTLGINIGSGLAGAIVTAVIGAVVILFVVGLIKKK